MKISINVNLQQKICSLQEQRHILDVAYIVDGQKVGTAEGTYQEVLNFTKLRERLGYDKIPDLSKPEFSEAKLSLDESLKNVDTEYIYDFQGWHPSGRYYILGNYKVTADNVSEVLTTQSKLKLALGTMLDKKILLSHLTSKYFKVLKHDVKAKIIFCISLLALFTTKLQQTAHQPAFATYICAKYNTGKSSSIKAMVNPWNGDSCSFEDTPAVITQSLKDNRDRFFIIDDMSKSKRPNMVNKNEQIIRLAGDTTTSAKKMRGGKIDNSMVSCMTVMTGEDVARLQNSSYTRMFIIKFDNDEVQWNVLTELQKNTKLTTWLYVAFLQWSLQSGDFVDRLVQTFLSKRAEYRVQFKNYSISNRFVDMCAWITAMWSFVQEFAKYLGGELSDDDFVQQCEQLILGLGEKYSHKSASQMFLKGLFTLQANNNLNIVTKAQAKDGATFDLICQESKYFIKSGVIYEKIKAFYENRNIDFYDSERAIRQDLAANGLLYREGKYLTSEFKDRNNKSTAGFWLYANNAQDFLNNGGNVNEF